jgi:hypothetical protein
MKTFLKRIIFSLRRFVSRRDVMEKAEIVQDVLFGHATVDVDEKVVNMTATLVTSLSGNASAAVVDTGLFIFIKIPDGAGSHQILAKRLTVDDRRILNNDPTLISQPQAILQRIKDAKQIEKDRLAYMKEISDRKTGRRGKRYAPALPPPA